MSDPIVALGGILATGVVLFVGSAVVVGFYLSLLRRLFVWEFERALRRSDAAIGRFVDTGDVDEAAIDEVLGDYAKAEERWATYVAACERFGARP